MRPSMLDDAVVLELVEVVLAHHLGRDRPLAREGARPRRRRPRAAEPVMTTSLAGRRRKVETASDSTRVSRRGPLLVRPPPRARRRRATSRRSAGRSRSARRGTRCWPGRSRPWGTSCSGVLRSASRAAASACSRCLRSSSASCLTKYSSSLRLGLSVRHRLGALSVDARGCHAAREVKNPRPSAPPSSGSATRSGCGMMPTTLPAAFEMPAMSLAEPFGLGWSGEPSTGRHVAQHDPPLGLEHRAGCRRRRRSGRRRAPPASGSGRPPRSRR